MRLIDADALDKFLDSAEKEATKNRRYVLASAINTIRGNIRNFPSTEPEIIRCKDCLIHGVCRFEQGLGLDGYCSQAERRTDE